MILCNVNQAIYISHDKSSPIWRNPGYSYIKGPFIAFILLLISIAGYAQQETQYTQYMYNANIINPAYTGSREVMSIFGLYRTQWVGLEGAPATAIASMHIPIKEYNVGLGLTFKNENIGPVTENQIAIDYSYNLPIPSYNYKLCLGLKTTAQLLNLDVNKLQIQHPNDPLFQNQGLKFSPNVGVGIYIYSDKSYFGLSVPNLLETTHYKNNTVSFIEEHMHYYFMTGYVFDLSRELQLKPTLLIKAAEGAPLQVDLSANFFINQNVMLGAAYRWDAAISALAGFRLIDSLFIGYAYDLGITRLSNYNSGSHEIFMRFELPDRYSMPVKRFF